MIRNMRVLFLNENPLPAKFTKGTISGKELRLRSAIREIDEVHVLCRPGKSYVVKPGKENEKQTELERKIIVHYLPSWPYYLSAIGLFIWGCYWTGKLKPIVIEAESPLWSGPAAVALGKLWAIPSIVEVRASYREILKYRFPWIPEKVKANLHDLIYWNVLKNADGVIVNSNFYKKELAEKGVKSVEINPGIQYEPVAMAKIVKKNVMGYLGRLVKEKGVDLFIRAIAVARKNLKKKWKFEIVGEGDMRDELERIAFQEGVHHLIDFKGVQDNFASIRKWKVMVNPNTVRHPLEMVNVEAACMGVGVICFGDKNTPETVVDGKTGIKVKVANVENLAGAMVMVGNDRKLISKLGKGGVKLAKENYQMQVQVEKLEKLYKKLKII